MLRYTRAEVEVQPRLSGHWQGLKVKKEDTVTTLLRCNPDNHDHFKKMTNHEPSMKVSKLCQLLGYADCQPLAHQPEGQMQWYAYFAPHSHEQHLDLLAQCQLSDLAQVDRLGATADGRDLHRLVVGNGPL